MGNVDWLLEGDPWVVYRTRRDLMDQSEDELDVMRARESMLSHPLILDIIAEGKTWSGKVLNSHKSPSNTYHRLAFLADIGLNEHDKGIADIAHLILEHQSPEGPFELMTNIPKHFGGSGEDEWSWALCDAPVVLNLLVRFGHKHNPATLKARDYLVGLLFENGWHCSVSHKLGKFRGPGRKDDPCPYCNLIMLKLLWQYEEFHHSKAVQTAVECLLGLWTESMNQHPYMFYMGNDFRKLKAPLIWYDILHLLDVISQYQWTRSDKRVQEMLSVVKGKADQDGRYTPESVYQLWKDYDIGQKKTPSRYLTYLVYKILSRFE